MQRVIAVYGIIGGVIIAAGLLIGINFVPHGGALGMAIGYLTMLIAMSMVFVGVKRYRDTVQGGVIRFWRALGIGMAIALVASIFYVLAWEVYLYQTNYAFADVYIAQSLQAMHADGKPVAEIAAAAKQLDAFRVQYSNPALRALITLSEIAPVGLIVSIVSAAVLRNSRAFPAVAPKG